MNFLRKGVLFHYNSLYGLVAWKAETLYLLTREEEAENSVEKERSRLQYLMTYTRDKVLLEGKGWERS